jgi:hypothetical protein
MGDSGPKHMARRTGPEGHRWAEPRFPRRLGVEILEKYIADGKHL